MQATKVVLESLGMALGHISWCLQREIQAGLSKWAIVRQELSGGTQSLPAPFCLAASLGWYSGKLKSKLEVISFN